MKMVVAAEIREEALITVGEVPIPVGAQIMAEVATPEVAAVVKLTLIAEETSKTVAAIQVIAAVTPTIQAVAATPPMTIQTMTTTPATTPAPTTTSPPRTSSRPSTT